MEQEKKTKRTFSDIAREGEIQARKEGIADTKLWIVGLERDISELQEKIARKREEIQDEREYLAKQKRELEELIGKQEKQPINNQEATDEGEQTAVV